MNVFEIYQSIYSRFKGGNKVDAIEIIELIKQDLKTLDSDFLLDNIRVACEEGKYFLEKQEYEEFQDCLFILKLAVDELFSRIQDYQKPDLPSNVIHL